MSREGINNGENSDLQHCPPVAPVCSTNMECTAAAYERCDHASSKRGKVAKKGGSGCCRERARAGRFVRVRPIARSCFRHLGVAAAPSTGSWDRDRGVPVYPACHHRSPSTSSVRLISASRMPRPHLEAPTRHSSGPQAARPASTSLNAAGRVRARSPSLRRAARTLEKVVQSTRTMSFGSLD